MVPVTKYLIPWHDDVPPHETPFNIKIDESVIIILINNPLQSLSPPQIISNWFNGFSIRKFLFWQFILSHSSFSNPWGNICDTPFVGDGVTGLKAVVIAVFVVATFVVPVPPLVVSAAFVLEVVVCGCTVVELVVINGGGIWPLHTWISDVSPVQSLRSTFSPKKNNASSQLPAPPLV